MVQATSTPIDLLAPAQSGGMSDHLVRTGHLKDIQRQRGWDDSELARQCGKSPQQVHSWFVGKRNIGEKLARELEERLGLPRYSLDDRNQTPEVRDSATANYHSPAQQDGVRTRARELPVLAWADINTMLNVDNTALKQKATHLETFAVSSGRAKFLRMPDDSMADEIAPGDHLLFDPAEAPRAGDIVLVRAAGGEHFVRLFRPRTAYVFEAAASNPAYQALNSQDDGATVIGVMVEHRRYRRVK